MRNQKGDQLAAKEVRQTETHDIDWAEGAMGDGTSNGTSETGINMLQSIIYLIKFPGRAYAKRYERK